MNQNVNVEIAKMRSLMERMNHVHTNYQAMLNEEQFINEATGAKKAVTRNEIIDILEDQDTKGNGGLFATVVYAAAQSVYKTKRKGSWRPDDVNSMLNSTRDEFGDSDWHKELSAYNAEGVKGNNPITNILVVTKYKINWTTKNNYNNAYNQYSNNLRNLRMSYGIARNTDGTLGDNHNQRQTLGGTTQMNQTGNLSKDFNMASAVKEKITMYRVDADGNVVGEIPEAAVRAMSAPYKPQGPEKAVREVLSDEEIEAYMKAKSELDKKFRGQTLNFDGMLAISANVNGVSYYYINDKGALTAKNGFYVNPQDLIKIAEENIKQKFTPINGFAQ